MGPCTYDVRKILGILDTPLPLVRISRNLSVLFVRKIGQFLNPPPCGLGVPLVMANQGSVG